MNLELVSLGSISVMIDSHRLLRVRGEVDPGSARKDGNVGGGKPQQQCVDAGRGSDSNTMHHRFFLQSNREFFSPVLGGVILEPPNKP